jgi:hypothetical protein
MGRRRMVDLAPRTELFIIFLSLNPFLRKRLRSIFETDEKPVCLVSDAAIYLCHDASRNSNGKLKKAVFDS